MALHYRIGEFAELSGISTKTLRFYDEIGLLRPASVDPRTRYRLYVSDQLQDLASILALKDVGVSLADVRNVVKKARSRSETREVLNGLKRTVEQSLETARQSLSWIDAALEELDDSEHPIPVIVKRRPPILIASVRATGQKYADIERFERQLLKEVPAHAIGNLRGVLWHRCSVSGCVEGEPFIALRERVPARSVYDLSELPAATLACAYSESDEISSVRAYDAIRRWMEKRGYARAGPKREIYVDKLLEIQFPLTSL
jgi:DNA-binding transcriptional MerR regulator